MTARFTGGRILVVEDNRVNSVVTRRLVELAGFTADAAYSGKEAFRRLADHSYDLVLMDLQLPDITGFETARSIREEGSSVRNRSVPIVALTGYADAADREACSQVGIDTVIEKPIDRARLAELVRRYVLADGAGAAQPAQFAAGKTEPPTAGPAPPFVAAELEKRLGSEQLARTVAARFLDVLDARHAAVEAALASGEAAEIRAAAHNLAGPAANSGAPALHALLKRMEAAAAAAADAAAAAGASAPADAPETEAAAVIRECAADLDAEVERVRAALEEYLD